MRGGGGSNWCQPERGRDEAGRGRLDLLVGGACPLIRRHSRGRGDGGDDDARAEVDDGSIASGSFTNTFRMAVLVCHLGFSKVKKALSLGSERRPCESIAIVHDFADRIVHIVVVLEPHPPQCRTPPMARRARLGALLAAISLSSMAGSGGSEREAEQHAGA
uniref:Uncharacterized protein n=1 Tax=Oryza sativa subsp. japonica TaxID=39947 RepID=Q6ZFY3_ORYSJ|nr:hypothetical protein [Oryza sativa Japonica Group]BAD07772.1 hypothetical protein [Oryza sativa Japonica Group]